MNVTERGRRFTVVVTPSTVEAIDRVASVLNLSRSGLIDMLLGVMVPTLDALAVKAEAARDAGKPLTIWDVFGHLIGLHRDNTAALSNLLDVMSIPHEDTLSSDGKTVHHQISKADARKVLAAMEAMASE